MFLDTFISEANDGVLYFFNKKTKNRENLLFSHTKKVVFIESKKISLTTHLATFPSSFFLSETPVLPMHYMDVSAKVHPRLMLLCNVVLGCNLTMIASKTTEQPAQLHSEACFFCV